LRVRFVPAGEAASLNELWKKNAARQKLSASLSDVIESIGRWMQQAECGFIGEGADASGRVHAAGLFGYDAKRVYYLAGASDPELLGSGAPTLLHFEVLREIERRGLPLCYDWVGANTPQIVRFKRSFG